MMTEKAEKMKLELATLPSQDRAALAQFLIHSLDEGAEGDVEAAWDTELARRAKEINSGTMIGESAEKVLADLFAKYATRQM
jgi:putative addiction module component (TIGR02574 family)